MNINILIVAEQLFSNEIVTFTLFLKNVKNLVKICFRIKIWNSQSENCPKNICIRVPTVLDEFLFFTWAFFLFIKSNSSQIMYLKILWDHLKKSSKYMKLFSFSKFACIGVESVFIFCFVHSWMGRESYCVIMGGFCNHELFEIEV